MVAAPAVTCPVVRLSPLFVIVAVCSSIAFSLVVKGLGYVLGLDDKLF